MVQDQNKRKVTIEQHKKFSQSALWRLQREYFDKEGIDAWVNQVPFYITSNPFIANCYAELVKSFILDWIKNNPEARKHPFYILELGTGSGRFSFYFVKTLTEILQSLHLDDIKICYIMSDFTKHNVKYWETHPALKPYLDKGIVDFAIFDMETERPITLIHQNVRLTSEMFYNPLTVFANYIFDTVSHDSFAVHEGKLYELLLTLSTDSDNMENNRPVDMEKISVDYSANEIKNNHYYGDPHLDTILEGYKTSLDQSSFLFPIGSFHALKFLKKIANNKLFIISTDKGYSTTDALDHLGHPTISFHGSFSMMVNFHAMGEYFKNIGGDSFLQTNRKGIKTSAFAAGFTFKELPQTALALKKHVEEFSPSDYFTLHRRMSDSFQECSLDTIASHMILSGWDPHIYLKLSNRVTSLVNESDSDTLQFLAAKMPLLAANYYHMPRSECVLFEIGVYFHAIKNYDSAIQYYLEALPYVGKQFGLYYNLALCYHHVNNNEKAMEYFKEALALDNDSSETKEWVDFLSKTLSEKT